MMTYENERNKKAKKQEEEKKNGFEWGRKWKWLIDVLSFDNDLIIIHWMIRFHLNAKRIVNFKEFKWLKEKKRCEEKKY